MADAEFSRIIRMDEIGPVARMHKIEADATEREALIKRFGLSDMAALKAEIALSREGANVRAQGRVESTLGQLCVVSNQPLPVKVRETVDVLFSRAVKTVSETEELELGADDCDILELEGEWVDIGELAAETVFLALDPYARLDDEALAEHRKMLLTEEDARKLAEEDKASQNPFAALKQAKTTKD